MSSSNPKISVIVPVYKVEKYLSKCLDSILNQTYTNLEIIIVDDGSPDNCGTICDTYDKKDSRITVLHQKNQGLSMARNNGLELATGDYIGFVDSDDSIGPTMYEELLGVILYLNVQVAECPQKKGGKIVYNGPESRMVIQTFDQAYTRPGYISFNNVTNKLYTRNLIKDLSFVKGKIMEDIIFTSQVWQRIPVIGFTPLPLYNYTVDSVSILRSPYSRAKIDGLWLVVEAMENFKALAKKPTTKERIRIKLLKTLVVDFHALLDNPQLDADQDTIKKIKKMIQLHSKIRFTNPYISLINILPIRVYRLFHELNRKRIQAKSDQESNNISA